MDDTRPRLIAHIGTAKTGTSAIQHALGMVDRQLRSEGIVHLRTTTVPGLVELPRPAEPDEHLIQKVRDSLVRAARREATLLLSWEVLAGDFEFRHFSNSEACAESLRRATDDFDVTIVIYLRRQDTFIESTYAQTVHTGRSMTFSEYLDALPEAALDWHRLLGHWADRFGRERMVVRRYDRSLLPSGSSIIREFASIIGSQALAGVMMDGVRTNASYSRDALEVARVCNEGLDDGMRHLMRMLLQRSNSKLPFEKAVLLTPEQRREVLAEYADSNAAVARDYFDLGEEPLFSPPTEAELSEPPTEGLTIEAVARVLMRAEIESHARLDELASAMNQVTQQLGTRRGPGT